MLRISGILAAICFLMAGRALAENTLFDDSTTIGADLVGPFAAVRADKTVREEKPFVLRAEDVDHAIKVRLRGKSRVEVCKFPPLRLNFRKSATADTVFAGQNKLKLVVPCSLSTRAEKDLLEEYAAYRIFNILSDASYRVRLMHILFSDPDDGSPAGQRHYAFVIEPTKKLVERLHGVESELTEVSLSWLDQRQLALMFLFQFLIGNMDWSLVQSNEDPTCCHNGTLVETDAATFYVPYDFDLSGLVDARYARREPGLVANTTARRRYRGFCIDRGVLGDALSTVRENEEQIIAVVSDLPLLSESEKNKRVGFLNRFFKAARDEEKMLEQLEKRCIS